MEVDKGVNFDKVYSESVETKSEVKGMQIFNYITYLILSGFLLVGAILYFPEISLAFNPIVGIAISLIGVLIFFYGAIQLFRFFPSWVKAQSPMAIVISISIILIAIIFLIVLGNPFSKIIDSKFSYTKSQITGGNLSNYLGLEGEIDITQLENRIHELINVERQKKGLQILSYDNGLSDIARAHSLDMVKRNYFEHISPDGDGAIARGNNASYDCTKVFGLVTSKGIAENLALTPIGNSEECGKVYTLEHIAECTVKGWMNSPPHKKNIVTESYDKEGIGIVKKGNEYYVTQNFC